MNRSVSLRLMHFSNASMRNYKTVKFAKGMSQLRDQHKRDREIISNKRQEEKEAIEQARKKALAAIPPIILFKLSCPGCGAKYQHKLPGSPGYLPYETMMTWKPSISLACERCETLADSEHHNMYSISEKRFKRLVEELATKKALGLVICDIVGFPSLLPPNLENIFPPGSPLILVLNKCDVLTESVAQMEIVKRYYELLVSKWAHHTTMKFIDIHFVSAKTGSGLPELAQIIQNYMYGEHMSADLEFCYLMGVTNVGKSTLFNKLVPLLNNRVKSIGTVTESPLPGTTVNKIVCPIFPAPSSKHKKLNTNITDSLNQKAHKLEKLMVLAEHDQSSDWFTSQIDTQLQEYAGVKVMVDTPGVLANDVIPETACFSGHRIYQHDVVLQPGQCLSLGWYKIYYVRGNIGVQLYVNVPLATEMDVITDVDDASLSYTDSGDKLCNKVYLIQSINLPQKLSQNSPTADICMSSLGWASVRLSQNDDVTIVVYGPRVEDIFIRRPGFSLHLPTRLGGKVYPSTDGKFVEPRRNVRLDKSDEYT